MAKVKTGQVVSISGQYRPVGSKNEFTFVEGKKAPPTTNGFYKFCVSRQNKT